MLDSRTRLGREVAAEVHTHLGDDVFATAVPRNVRLGEAPSHCLPISRYDPTCVGSDAYFDLAKEIVDAGAVRPAAILGGVRVDDATMSPASLNRPASPKSPASLNSPAGRAAPGCQAARRPGFWLGGGAGGAHR